MMKLSKLVKEETVVESEANESTPIITGGQHVTLKGTHGISGLSLGWAICFIVGEMIGGSALALPKALSRSGWIGVILLCCTYVVATYNGRLLGNCWTILLERHTEYHTHVRYPYAAIAEKAVGKWMKYITSACLTGTCFGTCTIAVLIISENLHSIVQQTTGLYISFCLWMVIVSLILVPLTWFASPKDFRLVAATASISALLALLLIFIRLMMSLPPEPKVSYAYPKAANSYFLSFGTISFVFSGASTFPTIQHDMKEPLKFGTAVVIADIVGLIVYLTISVSGYYVYGKDVDTNILYSLPNGGLRIAAEVLIIIHLVCGYLIYINPMVQNLEESCHVPLTNSIKNWKRLLFRTFIVLLVLFFAETVPHFGVLISLMGGSTSGFLTFIAPNLFYLCLCKNNGYTGHDRKLRNLSKPVWILNVGIIIVGVVVAVVSTYGAVVQLLQPDTFVPPCYVNSTAAQAVYNYRTSSDANHSHTMQNTSALL